MLIYNSVQRYLAADTTDGLAVPGIPVGAGRAWMLKERGDR